LGGLRKGGPPVARRFCLSNRKRRRGRFRHESVAWEKGKNGMWIRGNFGAFFWHFPETSESLAPLFFPSARPAARFRGGGRFAPEFLRNGDFSFYRLPFWAKSTFQAQDFPLSQQCKKPCAVDPGSILETWG